jgi:hypothetical protein
MTNISLIPSPFGEGIMDEILSQPNTEAFQQLANLHGLEKPVGVNPSAVAILSTESAFKSA